MSSHLLNTGFLMPSYYPYYATVDAYDKFDRHPVAIGKTPMQAAMRLWASLLTFKGSGTYHWHAQIRASKRSVRQGHTSYKAFKPEESEDFATCLYNIRPPHGYRVVSRNPLRGTEREPLYASIEAGECSLEGLVCDLVEYVEGIGMRVGYGPDSITVWDAVFKKPAFLITKNGEKWVVTYSDSTQVEYDAADLVRGVIPEIRSGRRMK